MFVFLFINREVFLSGTLFYPFLSKLSMYKNGSKTGQTYLMLYMKSKICSYDSEFHDNLTYPYTLENIFILYIYILRILASFLLFTTHGKWSFLPNILQTSSWETDCNILWSKKILPNPESFRENQRIRHQHQNVLYFERLSCYQPDLSEQGSVSV